MALPSRPTHRRLHNGLALSCRREGFQIHTMSKITSWLFLGTKPGTKGRRSTRHLDNEAVNRAMIKAQDPEHQKKFMTPGQRLRAGLIELQEAAK